jgi:pimeloyl-ACP methyl ester carboxylesterase
MFRGVPMKAYRGCSGVTGGHWLVPQGLLLLPRALMLVFLLLGLLTSIDGAEATSSAQPRHHVYLIRGFMNVFSLGMDDIAAKLQQQGINATVHNHLAWAGLAQDAAADYKSGRVRTIILVGHSLGASAVTKMAARLGELGVPVALAIGLDPVYQTAASGHVARYVNYYVSSGVGKDVKKTRQFSGTLQNVDVEKPDIGHLNIDKNPAIMRKIIAEIRATIYADRPAVPTQDNHASTKQSSVTEGSARSPSR